MGPMSGLPAIIALGPRVFGVGLMIQAFLLGFRHGIDWDHIAAITDITSSQDDRRTSVVFGTAYALGHALVVLAIGLIALILGQNLPAGVDRVMGHIVGFTLIVLGVYVVASLIRHGREFRMRSRWMLIFAGLRKLWWKLREPRTAEEEHESQPVHVHASAGEGLADTSTDVAGTIPVSQWHHGHHGRPGHHHHKHPEPDDPFMDYQKGTAFFVGMIHGVGGETPTQVLIFLTVAGVGGKAAGVVVLVAFLLGLLSSNSMITVGSAYGFLRASQNWAIYVTVAVLTAGFSLVIGTIFLLGKTTILPAIFGG
jgi:ABC-type nickel/cobalt efflux system permease component RcnA